MLINCPTLSARDREVWRNLERYDQLLAPSLTGLHQRAAKAITRFWEAHPDAVCSTSWGKDSTVLCHMVREVDPTIPIVWVPTVRADGTTYEADATYQVRDSFLTAFPGTYWERPVIARNPKRGDPTYRPDQFDDPTYRPQDVLSEAIHEPYISGVRAEESAIRKKSRAWHGISTNHTCRPIIDWTAPQVFAYLTNYDLPIHPAYAATFAGHLDRRWLRVHPLRSKQPARSRIHGWDMDGWEDHYFPTLTTHRGPHEPS